MANQTATKIELTNGTGNPRRYTISNATAIPKNSLLTLSDPRTAAEVTATSTAAGLLFAGIAAMAKEASDGATTITAWTDGIFKMAASGAITVGAAIRSCGTGYVQAALAADVVSGAILGYALETAGDGETFQARIQM